MDNVEILKMLFALLVIITILLSFILSLIIFRISLESDERDIKKEKEIKNRIKRNDR
jgi:mannitol-specific phosphotransferase system IIBC component